MMKNSALTSIIVFYTLLGFSPFALAQTPASATPSILSATEHSGYTTPENAFENHCELDANGKATGYFSSGWTGSGWTTTVPLSFQLTNRALSKVKAAIANAKAGPIKNFGGQCDAPIIEISALAAGDSQNFAVESMPDCAPTQTNTNPAADDLRAWAANLCKIKN